MGCGLENPIHLSREMDMGLGENAQHSAQYDELLQNEGEGLQRLVAGYVSNPSEQEDLGQDIALALWKALPTFRGEASIRTFAYRVAHNRCINFICRRKPQADGEVIETLADSNCVHAQVVGSQRRELLYRSIRKLPLDYRQIIMLALEDMTHREIATVVGITENNVAVKINRAKQMLRKYLGESS